MKIAEWAIYLFYEPRTLNRKFYNAIFFFYIFKVFYIFSAIFEIFVLFFAKIHNNILYFSLITNFAYNEWKILLINTCIPFPQFCLISNDIGDIEYYTFLKYVFE